MDEQTETKQANANANDKLVFAYNSFLVDFLLLVKRVSPGIRQRVKEHYRSVDKRVKGHIDFAVEHMPLADLAKTHLSNDVKTLNLDAAIVDGVTLRDVIAPVLEGDAVLDEGLRSGLLRNLYVLASLARLHQMHVSNAQSEDPVELLNLIMRIQAVGAWTSSSTQTTAPEFTGLDKAIEAVEDECVRGLLSRLFDVCVVGTLGDAPTSHPVGTDIDDLIPASLRDTFATIQGGKIGSIAKEIAEEIDFSGIDPGKPEQWLDIANITNPNSFLGSIVGKLGTKISAKMQSGELKQEDILADAASLMSSMGMSSGQGGQGGPQSNPMEMLQTMMAGMSGMGGMGGMGGAGGPGAGANGANGANLMQSMMAGLSGMTAAPPSPQTRGSRGAKRDRGSK